MLRTLENTPLAAAILAIGLVLGLAGPAVGQSFERCDSLFAEVYQIFLNEDRDSPETLRRIAVRSGEAETCYGQEGTVRRIWLREMRIWALDELAGHIDFIENTWLASRLSESFWEDFGQTAGPRAKANIALSLIRYRRFKGDFEGAMMALDTAKHYIDALPLDAQFMVRLNEASIYHDVGQNRRAEAIAGTVLDEMERGEVGGDEAEFAHARALHIRGMARIELGKDLSETSTIAEAIEDLEKYMKRAAPSDSMWSSAKKILAAARSKQGS